jgi:hypothetical protein
LDFTKFFCLPPVDTAVGDPCLIDIFFLPAAPDNPENESPETTDGEDDDDGGMRGMEGIDDILLNGIDNVVL